MLIVEDIWENFIFYQETFSAKNSTSLREFSEVKDHDTVESSKALRKVGLLTNELGYIKANSNGIASS